MARPKTIDHSPKALARNGIDSNTNLDLAERFVSVEMSQRTFGAAGTGKPADYKDLHKLQDAIIAERQRRAK